jgi:ADP-ribosyl-[dinitrogen reductase] hydrolase
VPITLRERIEGAIVGLLVGDALGVPYEFHPKHEIPPPAEIEFTPPEGFQRSHSRVLPGTWSDDGAHALILLASLLHCSKLDLDDLGQRFVSWYNSGYKAVDSVVFDVGIQTSHAINRLERGIKANESGSNDQQANGNGSLMRVLPLALWHKGTNEELVSDAHMQSLITHGHVRSQVCCALYCLWPGSRWKASTTPGNEPSQLFVASMLRDLANSKSSNGPSDPMIRLMAQVPGM